MDYVLGLDSDDEYLQPGTGIPGSNGVSLIDTPHGDVYSTAAEIASRCTLRRMNIAYRQSGGIARVEGAIAEFDRTAAAGLFAPMTRFRNAIGHPYTKEFMCFTPAVLPDLASLLEYSAASLNRSLAGGYRWALGELGTRTPKDFDAATRRAMVSLSRSTRSPISAYCWYGSTEAINAPDRVSSSLYPPPQETTRMTGLLGTLSNNQALDMSPIEGKVPEEAARRFNTEELGFVCVAHTAHSSEAMRARRVADRVSVRVLANDTIRSMIAASKRATRHGGRIDSPWTVFCMGYTCKASHDDIAMLVQSCRSQSVAIEHRYTVHVHSNVMFVVISVSSGVLLKEVGITEAGGAGVLADSTSVHGCDWGVFEAPVLVDKASPRAMHEYFSTFFMLVPFGMFDRPPRTVMASVQSVQGIASPWTPGASAYAPLYANIPLVMTATMKSILAGGSSDQRLHRLGSRIEYADIPPGASLMTLLMNMAGNYEDAAVVNQAAIDRGLFMCEVESRHVIGSHDEAPSPGDRLSPSKHRWWKMEDIDYRRARYRNGQSFESRNATASSGSTYGTVLRVIDGEAGKKTVVVRTIRHLETGDKLASWHGQKYTANVIAAEDMPICYGLSLGASMIPDVVISLSSLVNRQTNGAAMDMAEAMGVLMSRDCRIATAEDAVSSTFDIECYVIDGVTGAHHMQVRDDGVQAPLVASFGVTHFVQQTQTTFDKQHYTHRLASAGQIRPTKGRSEGGGISLDAMTKFAMTASGLESAVDELTARGDIVVVKRCDECYLLTNLCVCAPECASSSNIALPYGQVLTQISLAVYHGILTEMRS